MNPKNKTVDATVGGPLCLLVSWREEGRWEFLRMLREQGLEVNVLQPVLLGQKVPDRIKKFSVKLSRVYLPLVALLLHRRAGVWVTWNTPTGATLGLIKRFCRFRLPPHVVRDFHVDPGWERGIGLKMRVLHLAAPGMDFVLTTSTEEEEKYSKKFGFPRNCICFFPESPSAELLDLTFSESEKYIFSYGNSDRDFTTLVNAAKNLDRQVIILSQRYELPKDAPANVKLLSHFVSQADLCELIGKAECCVLPLKDFNVAAGQNVMMEIMTLCRPLIVSDNIATREYGVHKKTVHFYRIGDSDDLLQQIRDVLNDKSKAETMAQEGRKFVESLMVRELELFLNVLSRVSACA